MQMCRCKLDNKGIIILCLCSANLGISVLSNNLGYGTNIDIFKYRYTDRNIDNYCRQAIYMNGQLKLFWLMKGQKHVSYVRWGFLNTARHKQGTSIALQFEIIHTFQKSNNFSLTFWRRIFFLFLHTLYIKCE